MIQLKITETGKGYGRKSKWQRMNDYTKSFENLQAAKTFLKEKYGNCKRQKMYIGEGTHCGWIFCFHNSDCSHSPVDKWIQQDWVSFETVETLKLS